MKLYLVRHGETDYNVQKLIQGISDIALNDNGINQAKNLKKEIDKLNIDLIISSPLLRTKQTAKILKESKNIEIIYDDRLLERKFGDLEGKHVKYYDSRAYWNYELDYDKGEGVEKITKLFARTYEFLNDIKEKYKDKNILIISHGATIRAIHFNIIGFNKNDNLLSFPVRNCCLLKYEI